MSKWSPTYDPQGPHHRVAGSRAVGDRRAGRAGPRHQPGARRDVPGAGAGRQLALPRRYRLVQALLHSGRALLRRHRPGPSPVRARRQNDRPRAVSARPVAWHATTASTPASTSASSGGPPCPLLSTAPGSAGMRRCRRMRSTSCLGRSCGRSISARRAATFSTSGTPFKAAEPIHLP